MRPCTVKKQQEITGLSFSGDGERDTPNFENRIRMAAAHIHTRREAPTMTSNFFGSFHCFGRHRGKKRHASRKHMLAKSPLTLQFNTTGAKPLDPPPKESTRVKKSARKHAKGTHTLVMSLSFTLSVVPRIHHVTVSHKILLP